MASQPTHTSLRLRAPRGLPDPRPGCLLWKSIRSADSFARHSQLSDITTFALAERLCGAPDWLDPSGISRPCRCVRRAAPAAFTAVLRELLQHCSNPAVAGERRASSAPCAQSRTHPSPAYSRWIASSIYPDLINGRDSACTCHCRRTRQFPGCPDHRSDVGRADFSWTAPSIYPIVSFRQGQPPVVAGLDESQA